MKKLSEIFKELGIAFSFPITIRDANGNTTYYEWSNGYWYKHEYDSNGKVTYYEDSDGDWYKYERDSSGKPTYHENRTGYWYKHEFDANGKRTYAESSSGYKKGTPRASKNCEGKVVEVDGIKYELKAL